MDTSNEKERKVSPVSKANILSLLTFTYMFPIFKRSFKKEMSEDDLFKPLDEHKSSILGEQLEKIWQKENIKHKKTALHRALFKLFGLQFIWYGVLKFVDEVMMEILPPYFIGRLVAYYENKHVQNIESEPYVEASVIVLGLILNAFLSHPPFMGLMHVTMKMRISCSSLVYRKMLRVSQTAIADTTTGQLVNLLSNDVSKFDSGFLLAHYVWIAPLHAAIGTYFLYRQVGVSAFFGVVFLISFVPIQLLLGKRTSVLRLRTALRIDERVRLMSELVSGIQVIKMYCWEKPFAKLITSARKKEMTAIRDRAFIQSLFYSFECFVARTSVFLCILGYVLMGSYITAEKVFTIKAIYDVLRSVLILHFSLSASGIAETLVSLKRLQKFLCFAEREEKQIKAPLEDGNAPSKAKILLKNASATWTDQDLTLKDVTLRVDSNQVVSVIGPVGSGKSSLLNLLLKELPLKCGLREIQGKISYSSQEPWLFSGSVRQNICFNNEYNQERYRHVIEACALASDFEALPHGDRSLVGERGKALSGGQKARINLARCVYNEADIYLLDDPLSAVDANVGRHLYEKCIRGFLRNKIVILVTHQLQYLSDADKIVLLKDGRIEKEGKYDELENSGLDFAEVLKQFKSDARTKEEKADESEIAHEDDEKSEGPTMKTEHMNTGSIKFDTYFAYISAAGGKITLLLLAIVFLTAQSAATAADYYVSYWINVEQDFGERNPNDSLDRDPYIYTYSGIILGTIFTSFLNTFYYMFYFTIVSINLHHMSFSRLLQAPMKFFHNNPSSRILNRFSKDLNYIDEYIPLVLYDVIQMALMLLGSFILAFMVDLWLLIPAVVLVVIFYLLRVVYIKASRSVKRIEGITRSPIYGHMSASMQGLSTIRVFSAEEVLTKEFDNFQDNHSSAWYLFIASNRCFGFWIDIICILFFAVSVFILMYFSTNLHGANIGLVITQYTTFIGSLQWEIRQMSELENSMVSVERVLEYTRIESESGRGSLQKLREDWPNNGQIEFRNVSLKYDSADGYVLKDLNFTIRPREKVGIVGKTGAGKTSVITALFQLYPIEGKILIDETDTTRLPLGAVRSKIAIIPQEPVLFSGTIRKNLDPFEEFSDETLWNALDQVEFKRIIADIPNGLESQVTEGGSNFSVGQRQLLCLARALLRNSQILVMDEATANVDPQTDASIQRTIRERFSHCTVLTIAHRLHTVVDSDKIIVMNEGRVEEFDHPHVLLKDEHGMLYGLVQQMGKSTAARLKSIARENYEKKMVMEK